MRGAAIKAMAGRPPHLGPIKLTLVFFRQEPTPTKWWALWRQPVAWNPDVKKFVKRGHKGKVSPDLTNMIKSTEDAMNGIVFGDDVQSRWLEAAACFGERPGVVCLVHAIEDEDIGLLHAGSEERTKTA